MKISSKEVLRYLGYKGGQAGKEVLSQIKELISEFSANIVPKNIYAIFDCKVDEVSLTIGNLKVNSKNLAGHLTGCRRAVLLAATLGTEADTLIRRLSVQDMEKALIAQAVSAAMIEAYCDFKLNEIESELSQETDFEDLHLTARFSPGYGDFDIVHQKDILNMLNCSRIGLAMTEGYMLTPSKSITAAVGFSKEKHQVVKKCGTCNDKKCGLNVISK